MLIIKVTLNFGKYKLTEAPLTLRKLEEEPVSEGRQSNEIEL